MGESFWRRPPQWGFLENHPFTVLIDAGQGWRVTGVDSPRMRPHRAEPIRVVHMQDNFERFLTFDVTADTNRMRDHTTFTRAIDDEVLIATTTRAAAALGTSDPGAGFSSLLTLPSVYRAEDYQSR